MDLIEELKSIREKTSTFRTISSDLHEQKAEINKKIHLITIMECLSDFNAIIDFGLIQEHQLKEIGIAYDAKYSTGFNLYNQENVEIRPIQSVQNKNIYNKFDEIILKLHINFDYINEDSKSEGYVVIPLTEEFRDKFLNTFLNDELRKIIDYSELQVDCESKNNPNKKYKL
jgi:hypothetical protein